MVKLLNLKWQRQKGLTLLEMIISIGIFVLVATASSAIFNQVLIAYRYTTSRMSAATEASRAMDWIMRDIQKKTTVADVAGGFPDIGTPFPITATVGHTEITIGHPPLEPGDNTPVHYHLHAGDTRLWRERTAAGSAHDLVAQNIDINNPAGGFTFTCYDANNNDVTGITPNTANRVEVTIRTLVNGQSITLYNVADR